MEHITAEKGLQEDTAICFAYYNYQDQQLKDLRLIIATLIKQLCRRRDRIPDSLLQIRNEGGSFTSVGTLDRFVSLIEDLSEVYVVFDALDECPEEEREGIIGFITGIVTVSVPCRVKVFVTSRREMDIVKAFEDRRIPTIPVLAENVAADIEVFARSEIKRLRRGEHGKALYIASDELEERIAQTLAKKADGM